MAAPYGGCHVRGRTTIQSREANQISPRCLRGATLNAAQTINTLVGQPASHGHHETAICVIYAGLFESLPKVFWVLSAQIAQKLVTFHQNHSRILNIRL